MNSIMRIKSLHQLGNKYSLSFCADKIKFEFKNYYRFLKYIDLQNLKAQRNPILFEKHIFCIIRRLIIN